MAYYLYGSYNFLGNRARAFDEWLLINVEPHRNIAYIEIHIRMFPGSCVVQLS